MPLNIDKLNELLVEKDLNYSDHQWENYSDIKLFLYFYTQG